MRVTKSLFYSLLLGVFATTVLSQDNSENNTPAASTGGGALPTIDTTAALTGGVDPTSTEESTSPTTTTTSATSSRTTAEDEDESTSQVIITGGIPVTTGPGGVPALTTSSRTKALPKLTNTGVGIPVITIPPTANAPFMQKSTLPEGTVFIAVGSALAFFALAVIAWRGLVAWSLHRSVKRAAAHVHISDTKTMLRPPPNGSGGFYAGAGPGSQLSLDHLATSPRTATRPDGRQQTPNSSLFFSPTAGASATGGDRRSTYLPAGYYASGQRDSQVMMQGPANTSHTHLHTQSISSRYGNRNVGISPPGSPLIGPQGPAVRQGSSGGPPQLGLRASESHTSLSLPQTVRAPSAYLEDLFESHRQVSQGQNGRY